MNKQPNNLLFMCRHYQTVMTPRLDKHTTSTLRYVLTTEAESLQNISLRC